MTKTQHTPLAMASLREYINRIRDIDPAGVAGFPTAAEAALAAMPSALRVCLTLNVAIRFDGETDAIVFLNRVEALRFVKHRPEYTLIETGLYRLGEAFELFGETEPQTDDE